MAFNGGTWWDDITHAKATVTTSSAACADEPLAKAIMFQADAANAGIVTVQYGATAVVGTGWALAAGESTEWLPCRNGAADWSHIGSAGSQTVRYMMAH